MKSSTFITILTGLAAALTSNAATENSNTTPSNFQNTTANAAPTMNALATEMWDPLAASDFCRPQPSLTCTFALRNTLSPYQQLDTQDSSWDRPVLQQVTIFDGHCAPVGHSFRLIPSWMPASGCAALHPTDNPASYNWTAALAHTDIPDPVEVAHLGIWTDRKPEVLFRTVTDWDGDFGKRCVDWACGEGQVEFNDDAVQAWCEVCVFDCSGRNPIEIWADKFDEAHDGDGIIDLASELLQCEMK